MRVLDSSDDDYEDPHVTGDSSESEGTNDQTEESEAEGTESESGEESGDSEPQPVKINFRRRILESDSEDEPLISRKRKKIFGDEDNHVASKSNSDEHRDPEDEPLVRKKKKTASQPRETAGKEMFCGSDGEGGSEKCSICLLKLGGGGQEVGQPDGGCPHEFCLICISEWSKNVATCPIDRSEFRNIIVRRGPKGKEIRRQPVVKVTPKKEEEEELPPNPNDFVVCEACGSGDREDRLLLCDGCDLAQHLECLTPPLTRVPRGLWYCDTCERAGLVSSMNRHRMGVPRIRSDDEEPVDDLNGFIVPDDDESFMFSEEDVGLVSFVLPRTLQNVRIRRLVRTRRSAVVDTPLRPIASTSSGTTRKRKTTKKKTTRKRKKTSKRKSTSSSSTSKKRQTTKRKSTSKKRKLTMNKRKGGVIKKRSERKAGSSDSEKNNTVTVDDSGRLSLFGNPDELEYFGDGDDDDREEPKPSTSGFGSTLGNLPPVASRSKAISILNKVSSPSKPVAMVKPFHHSFPEKPATSNDLMGDILSSQSQTFQKDPVFMKDKRQEIYSKPQERSIKESRIISTTVSRSLFAEKRLDTLSKKGKTCDMSKIKSSAKSASANAQPDRPKPNPFLETPDKLSQFTASTRNRLSSSNLSYSSSNLQTPESKAKPIPKVNGAKESYDDKMTRLMKIGERVKVILKPYFLEKEWISKDSYKIILKKVVEKIYHASKNGAVPADKMERLIQGYVKIYRV